MKIIALLCIYISAISSSYAATLVYNVHGYSLDEGERISFVAMEYEDGRVVRLYHKAADVAVSTAGEKIDGAGATLLPGLIDAHGHVGELGRSLLRVDLVGSASQAEAVARVKARLSQNSDSAWLLGGGWNQVLWPDKSFPNRASLDQLGPKQAIALRRVDGHALWVNSIALQRAGITDATEDPAGGQIIRDEAGQATGVLIDNAMKLVTSVLPPASDEQLQDFAQGAMQALASLGLTSAHDARVSARELKAYQALRDSKAMPVRIYAMLDVLDSEIDAYLQQGPMIDPAHMLDVRSVKISSDGALGSRGAALFNDYSDQPGHKGLLLLSAKELQHHIGRAMAAGYQVNTHAIGDRANGNVLDYYEALIKQYDARALRHRIEHAQILRPADIPRLSGAGIIASIQPTHATSDKNMAGDRLGEERLVGAYAWNTLQQSGARIAGGSDFPIEHPNPFFGLHAAVTRQSHDNQPAGGWLPGEKVSRDVALAMFTEGAAYAAHQEKEIGSLLPGFYADFILVRDDYYEIPAEDIWKNKVLATYVAGKRVYQAQP